MTDQHALKHMKNDEDYSTCALLAAFVSSKEQQP